MTQQPKSRQAQSAQRPPQQRRQTRQASPPPKTAPPAPRPTPAESDEKSENNGLRLSAILVFMGSLLGSLIGTFTSVNDMFDSLDRVNDLLNPPTTLCIIGSGTILGEGLGMAAAWETDFEARRDDVDIDVNATGSLGGLDAAINGDCANVLAMSEAMTAEQQSSLEQAGIQITCAAEIGYDIIAFVTDNNNKLRSVEDNEMGNILDGDITNWSQIQGYNVDQPIFIYYRDGSGTTDYVLKSFGVRDGLAALDVQSLGVDNGIQPNASYLQCGSNSACLDATLSTSGAVYWVSTSWMRTQPEQYLRVLPILWRDERPINPLRDNFRIEEYPNRLIRPLYMYALNNASTSADSQALAQDYLRYIRGVDGQQILESYHFYNHFNQPTDVQLDLPSEFEPRPNQPRRACLSG